MNHNHINIINISDQADVVNSTSILIFLLLKTITNVEICSDIPKLEIYGSNSYNVFVGDNLNETAIVIK